MSCRRVRPLLGDYNLGVLAERETRRVEAHLEQCERCRRELAELRELDVLLGTLPDARPPRDLWPTVKARLRPRNRLTALLADLWQPALAVAAAVVLALIINSASLAPQFDTPVSVSAAAALQAEAPDEQLGAGGGEHPFADDAALGLSLAMLEAGGETR